MQSQGKVVSAQNQLVDNGRGTTLIATRSGMRKLGDIVKAVLLCSPNKMSNYICVSRASKDSTQAVHFPAKLEIR
jgi:hypothetical protein